MSDNEDALSSTLVTDGGGEAKQWLLCDRCKSLDLTVDKFIICNASAGVNIERDPQRHEPRRGEGKFLLKSGRSLKNFATLQKLRANRNICALCELVCRAIERYGHGNVNDKTSCSLSWEVHGRKIESGSSFVNSTRRIRLSWNEKTDTAQEVYMVFVAPRDPLRPNSDATSKWERDTHFLGREFGDQKENQALIKSWLDLCVKEHSDACRDTHGTEEEFKKLIKETYFGVIDVADMQLKSLPIKKGKPEPYVALSYVWGKKAHDELPYVTKRVNIMTHILHGGLETAWDRLPRTIQDAILLVSRLGYRYIWIDSLCIVQDSDSSWRLNARAMHLVYGNAHFTICAADGKDSSVGLRAVNPILRAMRPDQSAREVMSSISGVQSKDDYDSQPMSAECGFGVRLMVTRPLEAVVNDSEWNKRAWTFQERILSRRCLVFAEGRVYFECRSTSISQDIHIDRNNKGWSLDRTNSPLRTLRELQQRPLWFYMTYISMYTGRHLTKPRDILAAFEGISWLLEQYMDAPSLFGLPTSYFDLALLWGPLETLRCRRTRAPSESEKKSCTQDDLGNCTCESFGGLEFPTWSWSGWMGGRIEYQSSMLDGCLLNIREWLKHHTWIQWYIRDEKGHLRPLWEILSQRTDMRSFGSTAETEDDERWRGYPSNGSQGYGIPTQRRETFEVEKVLVERHSIRGEAPGRIRRRARESSPTRYSDDVSVSPSPRYLQDNELGPHFSPPPDRGPPPPAQGRSRRRETKEEDYSRDESPHNRRRIAAEELRDHTSFSENEEDSYSRGGLSTTSSTERGADFLRVSNRKYTESDSMGSIMPRSGPDCQRVTSEYYTQRRSAKGPERWHDPASSISNGTYGDEYGRVIQVDIPKIDELMFHAILPDNPFGVIRDHSSGGKKSKTRAQYMPILQFWTWRTELHVAIRDLNVESTIKQSNTGLCQCDIVDKDGDWCGFIVLDDKWIRKRQGYLFQFIAISDAKRFTQDECPVWTYYIPKERDESEWDLYYVLLLQRNVERGLWERAGLGKVFQAAFREKSWDEIKLG